MAVVIDKWLLQYFAALGKQNEKRTLHPLYMHTPHQKLKIPRVAKNYDTCKRY